MTDEMNTDDWFSDEIATFGDRLAAARDAAGLTQKELAQRLGVKNSTLRAWEDDLSEPRVNRLSHLAGLLGVSFRWLLTGEGEGVSMPEDDDDAPFDVALLLSDLRAVRAQMVHANTRLAKLEKRLRMIAKS